MPMTAQKNDITLQRITYLRGPKIWTYRSVLDVWLDLGELEDHPSERALHAWNLSGERILRASRARSQGFALLHALTA